LSGGNLLLNASLFHQTFTDFQLNSFLGTSYVVRSIPELKSRGLDLDLMWQTPVDGLSLQGGATWLDAQFGDDLLPDADLVLLPGATPGFMPRWQANASMTYEWDVADNLLGRVYLGGRYTGEHNTGSDLDPQKLQEAYTVVDARVVLGSRDRRWAVELWGRNLTDETYSQVGFDAPIQTGSWNAFLGAPRTYGVTLRVMYWAPGAGGRAAPGGATRSPRARVRRLRRGERNRVRRHRAAADDEAHRLVDRPVGGRDLLHRHDLEIARSGVGRGRHVHRGQLAPRALFADHAGDEADRLHLVVRKVDQHHALGTVGLGLQDVRSEEHTSELQSRENLVCRLL